MASLIVVYSAITWAGMGNLGRETWLRHGEAFAVAFSLPARFAVSRGRAGPCQVRPPAVRVFEGRGQAQRSQTPMLILMVGYTMISPWVLSQPIVA